VLIRAKRSFYADLESVEKVFKNVQKKLLAKSFGNMQFFKVIPTDS
jgi:hypothetical protein